MSTYKGIQLASSFAVPKKNRSVEFGVLKRAVVNSGVEATLDWFENEARFDAGDDSVVSETFRYGLGQPSPFDKDPLDPVLLEPAGVYPHKIIYDDIRTVTSTPQLGIDLSGANSSIVNNP